LACTIRPNACLYNKGGVLVDAKPNKGPCGQGVRVTDEPQLAALSAPAASATSPQGTPPSHQAHSPLGFQGGSSSSTSVQARELQLQGATSCIRAYRRAQQRQAACTSSTANHDTCRLNIGMEVPAMTPPAEATALKSHLVTEMPGVKKSTTSIDLLEKRPQCSWKLLPPLRG